MSTVGYGDIYCHTYFGKIFVMIFICIGLVSILFQNCPNHAFFVIDGIGL